MYFGRANGTNVNERFTMTHQDAEEIKASMKSADLKVYIMIIAHLCFIGYLYGDIQGKIGANGLNHENFKESTLQILNRLDASIEKLTEAVNRDRYDSKQAAVDKAANIAHLSKLEERIFRIEDKILR